MQLLYTHSQNVELASPFPDFWIALVTYVKARMLTCVTCSLDVPACMVTFFHWLLLLHKDYHMSESELSYGELMWEKPKTLPAVWQTHPVWVSQDILCLQWVPEPTPVTDAGQISPTVEECYYILLIWSDTQFPHSSALSMFKIPAKTWFCYAMISNR